MCLSLCWYLGCCFCHSACCIRSSVVLPVVLGPAVFMPAFENAILGVVFMVSGVMIAVLSQLSLYWPDCFAVLLSAVLVASRLSIVVSK